LNAGLEANDELLKKEWIEYDGVRVRFFHYTSLFRYAFSLSFSFYLLNIINEYEVIHITAVWNYPTFIAALLCYVKRKKFILSPTGALNAEAVESDKSNVKKFYYRFILRRLFKNAAYHFTSELDYKRFLSFNRSEVKHFINPNGFDINAYSGSSEIKNFNPGKRKYILFLGRIDRIKGLELLIKSFAAISKKFPGVDLMLAGPDSENYKSYLKKVINDLSLSERIKFPGMLNFDEKLSALKNCEFLVLPSYSENFGNVVVEAMLCRKTVIVGKNVGLSEEILLHNGGLVTEYDTESLSYALEKLLSDIDYRNTLAENGYNYGIKNFKIDEAARQMLNEYLKIKQ
ncbi:MAG: glycosyltransferase, partial [Ignavibacteria bacterium]|nr:glycosyltransferase [Ignavibacteria bacterium]